MTLCGASNVQDATPEFASAAEDWGGRDVEFFQGDEDWPSKAFKDGQMYLVGPDKNELSQLRQIKALRETIAKIL
jgi:hypothetical protein